MKAFLKRLCGRLFNQGFAPKPSAGWEWFFMRLFFAVVVLNHFFENTQKVYGYTEQKNPVGIAKIFDLTFVSEPWFLETITYVVPICLIIYVIGRGLIFVLPVLTILSTIVRTLQNSQGSIDHSHQIVTLVLLAQMVVLYVIKYREWKKKPWPYKGSSDLTSLLVYYSQGVIMAAYTVSAFSKFLNSKGMWIWNSPYIALDLVKSQKQYYYKKLDPAYAEDSFYAQWVLENPHLARIILAGGFFVEALAFIGLAGRRWALMIGLSTIAMHQGISLAMHHKFYNHQYVLLIFLVNVPFWFWWVVQKCRGAEVGELKP